MLQYILLNPLILSFLICDCVFVCISDGTAASRINRQPTTEQLQPIRHLHLRKERSSTATVASLWTARAFRSNSSFKHRPRLTHKPKLSSTCLNRSVRFTRNDVFVHRAIVKKLLLKFEYSTVYNQLI